MRAYPKALKAIRHVRVMQSYGAALATLPFFFHTLARPSSPEPTSPRTVCPWGQNSVPLHG